MSAINESSYVFVRPDGQGGKLVYAESGDWIKFGAPVAQLHQMQDPRAAMRFATSLRASAVNSGQYEHALRRDPGLGVSHMLDNSQQPAFESTDAEKLLAEADFDDEDLKALDKRVGFQRKLAPKQMQPDDIKKSIGDLHGYIADGWHTAYQIEKAIKNEPDYDDLLGLIEEVQAELWQLQQKFDRARKKLGIEYND